VSTVWKMPIVLSLGIIVAILGTAIVASVIATRRGGTLPDARSAITRGASGALGSHTRRWTAIGLVGLLVLAAAGALD
jgi:hypothetical protein